MNEMQRFLHDTYFSGVHDTLDSLIESTQKSIDVAKEMGIDDPKVSYKELLKTFNELKEIANGHQNN